MKEGVGAHGMERAGLSMSTWRLAVGEGLRRYDEAIKEAATDKNVELLGYLHSKVGAP